MRCFLKPDFRSLLGLSGKLVPTAVNKRRGSCLWRSQAAEPRVLSHLWPCTALQTYAVRTPAGHPVHENFRVHAFRQVRA